MSGILKPVVALYAMKVIETNLAWYMSQGLLATDIGSAVPQHIRSTTKLAPPYRTLCMLSVAVYSELVVCMPTLCMPTLCMLTLCMCSCILCMLTLYNNAIYGWVDRACVAMPSSAYTQGGTIGFSSCTLHSILLSAWPR